MKNRKTKEELEITKEFITPFVKRKPALKQSTLELPLPSPVPQDPSFYDEDTKEITVTASIRGVWSVEI